MTGIPSEMEDHPTKSQSQSLETESLFGEGRNLTVASNNSVFISSPAMKPSLSMNLGKRGFEDSSSSDMWMRVESAMEWDMRSPENVELEELDGMFDDL